MHWYAGKFFNSPPPRLQRSTELPPSCLDSDAGQSTTMTGDAYIHTSSSTTHTVPQFCLHSLYLSLSKFTGYGCQATISHSSSGSHILLSFCLPPPMCVCYGTQILHIDFGDCFEVAMNRGKFPEKIPFRLTRMLVNAMEVGPRCASLPRCRRRCRRCCYYLVRMYVVPGFPPYRAFPRLARANECSFPV